MSFFPPQLTGYTQTHRHTHTHTHTHTHRHTTSKAEETAGTKVQGRKELVTFEEQKVH